MTVSMARPAATVVVVREGREHGFEVLMVRRNERVAFMAGAYVFPGGRVDEGDVAAAGGDEALAFRLAAVRELEEEVAVRVRPQELVRFAHWITPEVETRRYDTHFFLSRMPEGQDARHDNDETTELDWLTPSAAIARGTRGLIMLPPPTWTTLRRLQRHRTVDDLFAWARGVATIPVVQPRFLDDSQRKVLTLPGDPTYPTIEGWDIPEDTRFVLEDGQWRPVRG